MIAPSDFPLIRIELLRHHFRAHGCKLLDKILRRVVKADEHDVEVTVHDLKVEAEAKLLLGLELRDHLHML